MDGRKRSPLSMTFKFWDGRQRKHEGAGSASMCVRAIMREMTARQRVSLLLSLNSYHHALAAAEGEPMPLNLTFSQWVNADEDRKITMKCDLTRSIAYAAWLAAGGRPE